MKPQQRNEYKKVLLSSDETKPYKTFTVNLRGITHSRSIYTDYVQKVGTGQRNAGKPQNLLHSDVKRASISATAQSNP